MTVVYQIDLTDLSECALSQSVYGKPTDDDIGMCTGALETRLVSRRSPNLPKVMALFCEGHRMPRIRGSMNPATAWLPEDHPLLLPASIEAAPPSGGGQKMVVYQPVPAPGSARRYDELVLSGVLVDMAGNPLVVGKCSVCGNEPTVLNITCALAVECPSCPAGVGQRCMRPSEHRMSDQFGSSHQRRTHAAAAVDDARIAAGDLTVPAPWAPPAALAGEQPAFLMDVIDWEAMPS